MTLFKSLVVACVLAIASTASHASTYALGDIAGGGTTTNTLTTGTLDYYTLNFGDGGTYLNFDTFGSHSLSGIDTELGLYDSSGRRVSFNDDTFFPFSLDSELAFGSGWFMPHMPNGGDYTLIVGAFNTVWTRNMNNIIAGLGQGGAYNLNISNNISAVPLPAGGLLLISGLFGIAVARRKKIAA